MTSPIAERHEVAGAVMDEAGIPLRYGSLEEGWRACHRGAALADLSSTGVLALVGPDARRFANGMFTNNIRDLRPGEGNRNAMCDDRGRMGGMLDVYCTAEQAFLLVLEGVTPEAFVARYQVYIVFDDVTLDDRTDDLALFTVQGPDAERMVREVGLPVPDAQHVADEAGRAVLRRDRVARGGFDLVVPRETAGEIWDALRACGAVPMGTEALEVARVEAGQPRWPADMSDKQLVHEMRLKDAAVSFEKGCYVGQETINRLDVRGQLRKELAGLRIAGDRLPSAGAEVRAGEQVVGTLTSPVHSPSLGAIGLSVLRKPHDQPGTELTVVDGGETFSATAQDLPFPGRGPRDG